MFNETSFSFGDVSLSPSQQQIAARILAIGQQRGESEKTIQAALATGWVESRYQNLAAGDRDSAGVMQQRPSQGWGSYSQVTNLDYAVNAFYDAANQIDSSSLDFGQLAQAVQRSAFPARYGAAGSIVDQILALFGGAGPGAATPTGSSLPDPAATISSIPVDLFSGAPAWLPVAAVVVVAWLFLK
jgi:hypothetical protein